ncbi:hypothetical protein [Scytonema sp. NUACC26]|uniref:hypothetical protein n=1 Tax=Scytonema sp. NUACC26 TaxID=3140176 RepID=UPI0038B30A75
MNDGTCDARDFLASKTEKFTVYATKVVVQPWRGEHNVYGIFIVPDEYERSPFFVQTVLGVGNYCEKPFGSYQKVDGISAPPGMHLIKDYIRTRTALRLILSGKYNQIDDKQNWTLTFPDKKTFELTAR